MTIWYRAHRSDKIPEVFSGDGGLYTAGRWNHLGNKAIYCSESIALCTLEWLAHHGLSVSGFDYYRYAIDIPDKMVARFSPSKLPKKWNAVPATDLTRDFAEEKLFLSARYLALAVPSVVVPEEYNLVINPMHKAYLAIAKSVTELGRYVAPKR